MAALLIGLGISFALGGLVYLNYEDEIDEAREVAQDNGIDVDDFDFSDLAIKFEPDTETDAEAFADTAETEDAQLAFQSFASAQTTPETPISFEPDAEQLVVNLEADVDLDAPAQNIFDPETDTTTLSIGDATVLSLSGNKTDISVGFGTQAETENGLSPFDVVLVQNRLEPA